MNDPEPCLCGDPECPACYPRHPQEPEWLDLCDERYEYHRDRTVNGPWKDSRRD